MQSQAFGCLPALAAPRPLSRTTPANRIRHGPCRVRATLSATHSSCCCAAVHLCCCGLNMSCSDHEIRHLRASRPCGLQWGRERDGLSLLLLTAQQQRRGGHTVTTPSPPPFEARQPRREAAQADLSCGPGSPGGLIALCGRLRLRARLACAALLERHACQRRVDVCATPSPGGLAARPTPRLVAHGACVAAYAGRPAAQAYVRQRGLEPQPAVCCVQGGVGRRVGLWLWQKWLLLACPVSGRVVFVRSGGGDALYTHMPCLCVVLATPLS